MKQKTSKLVRALPGSVSRRIIFISLIVVTLAALTRLLPRLSILSNHIASSKPLYTTVKMSAYSKELEFAELAVQRATILTKKVFHEKAKGTLSKDDKSPVTIRWRGGSKFLKT
jgi:3'(2'), 5'-bisphosphate nucleotidase